MAETLKEVIEQLKIQNTSSKLPVVGEIKNLGTQFGRLNFNFKRFTDSSVQLNSEMMEKNQLINAENLSNQNDNAELLNLQLMDIGNVFSTKIDDLKSLLVDGPRVSDEMLNEVKNQSNYMQELGMMQGDYFTELKQQLITNDIPTVEEKKEDNSDDKVAKDTLIVSKASNNTLNQLMSFFMAESERDKLKEQEEKNERKSSKPLSEKTVDPSRLIRGNKGILGILQDFLTTAFLGTKGKALLRSLIPGKFTLGGFGKTLMTGIAGVLFGPELLSVISTAIADGMKADDMTSGVKEGVNSFLKNADSTTLAALGGVGGLIVGGIPGAIAGALLGMAVKGIGNVMGGDKTVVDLALGDVTPLQSLLGGALPGAAIGFYMGMKTGPVGAIAGALLGASFGALAGFLANDDIQNVMSKNPLSFFLATTAGAGLMGLAGFKVGAALGLVGGPIGMLVGGMIGAIMGGLATYLFSKRQDEIKKSIDRTDKIVELESQRNERILELQEKGLSITGDEKLKELENKIVANRNLQTENSIGGSIDVGFQRAMADSSNEVREATIAVKREERLTENNPIVRSRISQLFDSTKTVRLGEKEQPMFPNFDGTFNSLSDLVREINGKQVQVVPLSPAEKNKMKVAMMREKIETTDDPKFADALDKMYNKTILSESLDQIVKEVQKTNPMLMIKPITEMRTGGFVPAGETRPALLHGPEMVFNEDQMNHLKDMFYMHDNIISSIEKMSAKSKNDFVKNPQIQERYIAMNTMQTENETRRREMATPIVMPPSAPNIVDNKNITVQEQFNVTEMLPAPSSHVSFKDNIVY